MSNDNFYDTNKGIKGSLLVTYSINGSVNGVKTRPATIRYEGWPSST
jgi:hypothetical protein